MCMTMCITGNHEQGESGAKDRVCLAVPDHRNVHIATLKSDLWKARAVMEQQVYLQYVSGLAL